MIRWLLAATHRLALGIGLGAILMVLAATAMARGYGVTN